MPPTTDPLAVMFAHDRWATNLLLDAAARLSDEPFHRRFDIGLGSLHHTLTHIIGVTRGWTAVLAADDGPSWLDPTTPRSVTTLRELHEAASDAFEREARSKPMDGTVTVVRAGAQRVFSRTVVTTHVLTHSMHHRAQALNILRQLGVDPLPMSAITQWSWSTDNGTHA